MPRPSDLFVPFLTSGLISVAPYLTVYFIAIVIVATRLRRYRRPTRLALVALGVMFVATLAVPTTQAAILFLHDGDVRALETTFDAIETASDIVRIVATFLLLQAVFVDRQ